MTPPTTPTVCPVCDFAGDRVRVYQHLQLAHRKSVLADALLAAASTPAAPPRAPSEL